MRNNGVLDCVMGASAAAAYRAENQALGGGGAGDDAKRIFGNARGNAG